MNVLLACDPRGVSHQSSYVGLADWTGVAALQPLVCTRLVVRVQAGEHANIITDLGRSEYQLGRRRRSWGWEMQGRAES
eukprot:447276-Hanusia_phi.AAC.1